MGWASELKTVTSEAVRKGLAMAVDTGREIVDCIKDANDEELMKLPADHFLKKEHMS
jgi:stearoyl-CoA desaturase (delta-9 desaturase)